MIRHLLRPHPTGGALGLALVAVLLGGCTDVLSDDTDQNSVDSSTAPGDATSQAFCDAYGLEGTLGPAADDDLATRLRADAASLTDVGTPDDIPDAARAGFVVYVAATGRATADEAGAMVGATSADQIATALGIASDDAKALGAFRAYVVGTCFVTNPDGS